MTLMSEIERVRDNIAAAYTALDEKGATLPESQNSANLAETIASVPSGGGGASFEALKQRVFSIENFSDSGSTKYSDFVDRGFNCISNYCQQNPSAGIAYTSSTDFVGLYFDDDIADFYVRPTSNFDSLWAMIVPEDATAVDLTEQSTGGNQTCFSVDLSTAAEKWIILIAPNSGVCDMLNFSGTSTFGGGYNNHDMEAILSHVRYTCIKNNSSTELSSSSNNFKVLNYLGANSSVLEGIDFYRKITGMTYLTDAANINNIFYPRSWVFDIKKFIEDNFETEVITYGTTQASASSTKSAFYNSYSKGRRITMAKKFPVILDFSDCSASTSTFYIGNKTNSWTNSSPIFGPVIQEMFIIPPDMNISWKVGEVNTQSNYITPESIKFFADHAPNVTSKTFTIGSRMIDYINNYDPTIITTLTSKGWTVN